MIILNFSHPLTDNQKEQIRKKLSVSIKEWHESKILRINCYINIDRPLSEQINNILDNIPENVWHKHILFIPPPIAHSAILITISIRERCGYYPQSIRIKRERKSLPPRYVIAEVINLNDFREQSRAKRQKSQVITTSLGEQK